MGQRPPARDPLAASPAFGDSILDDLNILEGSASQGQRQGGGAASQASMKVFVHLPRFTAVVHMPERSPPPPLHGVIDFCQRWSVVEGASQKRQSPRCGSETATILRSNVCCVSGQ